MKVVFLDFNGVLDTNLLVDEIDQGNLERLKYVLDVTGAKVVLTTSLKNTFFYAGYYSNKFKELVRQLHNAGIFVLDMTELKKTREEEIISYLEMHPEIENYCIIDDDYEMPKLADYLVKLPIQGTENQMGFTEEYMNMAINILKNKKLEKEKNIDKKNLN